MYAIGIDVGGMSVKIGLVSSDGKIEKTVVLKTEKDNQENFSEKIGETVLSLLKDNGIEKKDVLGIGVGCPGSVNVGKGEVICAPNVPWTNLMLKDILEKKTGIYVRIANDADCAALGEVIYGVGKGYNNVILLTIGTGVGSGIVINGKLYEGTYGMAGEMGHMRIVKNGRKCNCGGRGCYEQYASASALIRFTKEEMKKSPSSIMWEFCNGNIKAVNGITAFACAKKGDDPANKVVDKFVGYIADGVINCCNIFRPDCIIIGGGISKEGNYLIDKIKAILDKYDYGYPQAVKSEIFAAKLGNDAGIIGAASIVQEKR